MCKGLAQLPSTCLKSAKDIKHKIGFLLQTGKSDPPPELKQQVTKSVITPVEVKKWRESFNNVLNNQDGRAVFTDFLKSEFSQENMEFWTACEEYKMTPTDKMATKAREIYEQYIEADSPHEVNLDAASREETRQNVSAGEPSCFDEAQRKIFTLMEKDSYRRFLQSKLLRDQGPSDALVQDKGRGKSSSSEKKKPADGA